MKNPFRKRYRIIRCEGWTRPSYIVQTWSMEWPFSWWTQNTMSRLNTLADAVEYVERCKNMERPAEQVWKD